jgi:uncharacterized cupredoxin-like copper-binding protein
VPASFGLVLLLVASALGYGLGAPAGAQDTGSSSTVVVTQHDFKFRQNVTTVKTGTVTFRVHNNGPSTHEFNVDRSSLPDGSLPLRPDGLTVNEDSSLLQRIDSINTIPYRTASDLTLHLKPGRYVLYCNLEGHYLGGMHTSLVVK